MKFEVKFEVTKFRFFFILSGLFVLASAIGVFAYVSSPGAVPQNGHSLNQVQGYFSGDQNLQQSLGKFCQSDGANCKQQVGGGGITHCVIRQAHARDVSCNPGEVMTGGGCTGKSWDGLPSYPLNTTTWYCHDGGSDSSISYVYAVCCS